MTTRWQDEERWSPEDEAEARWEAKHVWPGATLDCSNEDTQTWLLNWLDNTNEGE